MLLAVEFTSSYQGFFENISGLTILEMKVDGQSFRQQNMRQHTVCGPGVPSFCESRAECFQFSFGNTILMCWVLVALETAGHQE